MAPAVAPAPGSQNMTHVEVPTKMSFGDRYAVGLAVCLLPLVFLILFLQVLLWLPALLMIHVYARSLEVPLKIVPRTCGFHLFSLAVFLVALPLIGVALIWVLLVVVWCLTLSLPAACCAPGRVAKSLRALAPYAGLPGAMAREGEAPRSPADELATSFGRVWPFGDIVVGLVGAVHRQGLDETVTSLPAMLTLIPLMKVTLLNPFLHELEEVYINQWSDPLDADADTDADAADAKPAQEALSTQVCSAILPDKTAELIDAWPFAGFHPFPPPGRRSNVVAGVQMGLGGKVLMLSHTYHGQAYVAGHTPRSEYGSWTCIVVLAMVWNPWYNLTGYVELNYRKDGGMEHPMWLLADRKSKLAMGFLASVNLTFVKLGKLFAEYLKTQPTWIAAVAQQKAAKGA